MRDNVDLVGPSPTPRSAINDTSPDTAIHPSNRRT